MSTEKLNPYLQKHLKEQMLSPMIKCDMYQAFCRFAIPGYCLIAHNQYVCEYASTGRKEVATFGEKGKKLLLSVQ